MVERGDGIAAAGNRNQRPFARQRRRRPGERDGCGVERRNLESAERTVPHQRAAAFQHVTERLDRRRPDIENHLVRRDFVDVHGARRRVRGKFFRDDHVIGQMDGAACGVRRVENRVGGIDEVVLAQRLADIDPARREEGVGHPATDDQMIDLADKVAQHVDLARHFRAADNRRNRMRGIAERGVKCLELGLHRATGIGGQPVGNALGRAVRAVRRRKGIVDIDVADFGKRIGERGVVLFLTRMKARIFEHGDVAGRENGNARLGAFADAVGDEHHRMAENVGDAVDDEAERLGRVLRPFRAAEMGKQQNDGALVRQFADRRHRRANSRVVGDGAVGHRHVEIDAHQHLLASDITYVVERLEICHLSLRSRSVPPRRRGSISCALIP